MNKGLISKLIRNKIWQKNLHLPLTKKYVSAANRPCSKFKALTGIAPHEIDRDANGELKWIDGKQMSVIPWLGFSVKWCDKTLDYI